MDKSLLEILLPFVNDPYTQQALTAYAEYRIALSHRELEADGDPQKPRGQIKELRRLLTLRDEVNAEAKRK